jgi:hypothetical protein
MRIQVMSDLHTEDYESPIDSLASGQVRFPGADVLALSGVMQLMYYQRVGERGWLFQRVLKSCKER